MVPLCPSQFLFPFLFLHVRAEMNSSIIQPPVTASMANASSLLILNASPASVSNFPFVIPYDIKQDCDIYGPACQTGSISVGVDLTTATATTVLPCSSYLSAQFSYLWNVNYPGPYAEGYNWLPEGNPILTDWGKNFGQSPECKSYADAMGRGQYTFSNCDTSSIVMQTAVAPNISYPLQIPPGLVRYFTPTYWGMCCGNCSLDIPEVRLYYFPENTTIDCYNNQTSNFTSSARNLDKRVHSLIANGSTAIISGHTFTSPSVYLQLMGTAAVHDQCTTVGPNLISPIITLPPGGLSTWKPAFGNGIEYDDNDQFTVGEIWTDPTSQVEVDIAAGIAPLDIKDLACPTWGLGLSTSADGKVITTIGPPWLPLIVPPMNIFSLNPTWASVCTAILIDQFELTTFALFDPPIALTPAPLLLPTPLARPIPAPGPAGPTSVSEQATISAEAAKPASLPNDPASPARTGDPGRNSPTPLPVIVPADPAKLAPLPGSSGSPSKNNGDPPLDPKVPSAAGDPPSDPKVPLAAGDPPSDPKLPSAAGDSPSDPKIALAAGDPPADPIAPTPSAHDPPPDDLQQSPTDPKVTLVPVTQPLVDPQTQAQGLGAIIFNAFGKSGPEVDGSPSPPQSILTIDAQTFTANPTGFKMSGAAVSPGGTAHIVDVPAILLDESGILAIGSSTVDLLPASKAYTVAGQIFTPNPSAFSIADTTISAGGPAVTIGVTIVSLQPSGIMIVGPSRISLSPPTIFSSDVDIDGFDVKAESSFAVVDGVTLSAGAAGVTISREFDSLGAGGATLDIGTGRFALPTPTGSAANGSVNVQAFLGGQGKGMELSLLLVCGVCRTFILLM